LLLRNHLLVTVARYRQEKDGKRDEKEEREKSRLWIAHAVDAYYGHAWTLVSSIARGWFAGLQAAYRFRGFEV
jgi:hypothetical protein